MTASYRQDEVERFRSLIARRFGLDFDDGKLGILADLLRRRLDACGLTPDVYLARLERDPTKGELRALAQELTVGETYFFRNIDQFRAFAEVALPDRLRVQDTRRSLRILSAGCASGEETYSIAILVREAVADPSWRVRIRGVDVNPASLEKAARGRFSTWALRETPPATQHAWLRRDGREVVVEDVIRNAVQFEERNLTDDDAELWEPSAYDIIFCRNVLMYFTPASAQAVVARIARAIAPGGYLFLGHAETLRGLSQDFHLRHTHGTFYYRRKDDGLHEPAEPSLGVMWNQASLPETAAVIESDDSWVDAIRRAAERIDTLTRTPASTSATQPRPRWELGLALDLLRTERFAEALDLVQALPPESARDPDVLLLQAVLLAQRGRLASAEEACRQLLALDELNAGAHYVLAMCREAAGDPRGATDHDQVAVYLDPAFAMPRLHLGFLARRAGAREAARRELGQALVLLEREDASRLLLFGGGFNRHALITLCRAELETCGGS